MPDGTDEDRLASQIMTAWDEHFFNNCGPFRFAGDLYDLPDEDQWKALGENPEADDLPLILVRASDGKFFEVDLEANVWVTSPEARTEARRVAERIARNRAALSSTAGREAPDA